MEIRLLFQRSHLGSSPQISVVVFAVASALCVSVPALSWRFKKDCRRQISLFILLLFPSLMRPLSLRLPATELLNLSITDCGKDDPEISKEMEKQFVDLLTEEVKLQEAVAEEHARHMNATFLDANKSASEYQKEAEKCIAATEICEVARERAEASLRKEKKITTLWERRSHQLGWQGT